MDFFGVGGIYTLIGVVIVISIILYVLAKVVK